MTSAGNETGAETTGTGVSFQQAIATQGALFSQHEELLCSLVESNRALLDQVFQLTGKIIQLTSHSAPSTHSVPVPVSGTSLSANVSSAMPLPVREPNVPVPENYRGDFGSCQSSLTEVSLVFNLQPQSYSSNRSKIAYLISLLSGSVREWGMAVSVHVILRSIRGFCSALVFW
uniref:DUF4939 domain-containing protein n=1 Tax=Amphiprion ocellaris TaxID=80972 RepID=A0A3Q1CEC3_AMPOC